MNEAEGAVGGNGKRAGEDGPAETKKRKVSEGSARDSDSEAQDTTGGDKNGAETKIEVKVGDRLRGNCVVNM